MPYTLPCEHNACLECLKHRIEVLKLEFICPVEGAFLNRVDEAVHNKEFFRLVKIKERNLKFETISLTPISSGTSPIRLKSLIL